MRPARPHCPHPPLLSSYSEPFGRLRIQTGPRVTPELASHSGEDCQPRARRHLWRARPAWSTSHRPTGAPSHPQIMQSSRGRTWAPSRPQPQARWAATGPKPSTPLKMPPVLHSLRDRPLPWPVSTRTFGALSRPTHIRRACTQTRPVLSEGTTARRAPGREDILGKGGASPRGIGSGAGAP